MSEARQFGRDYQLVELIDGSVWHALRRNPPGPVALKLVALSSSAEQVDRRLAADRALLTAVRHGNLVTVLDLVSDGAALGIVMDLVEGPSLAAELKRSSFAAADAARISAYICAGLAALHAQGLVHRDLSPAKVLLTSGPDGRPLPLVTGFAPARLSDGPDRACSIRNEPDPDYVAPEVLSAKSRGPEVDVYAVGSMLYELLSGHSPFGGRSLVEVLRRQAEAAPPPLPVAAPLWSVVVAMLDKNPASRPTARDAALALAELTEGTLTGPLDAPALPAAAVPAPAAPAGPFGPQPQEADAHPTVALPLALRQTAAPEPEKTVIRQKLPPMTAADADADAKAKKSGPFARLAKLFKR